MDIKLIALDLDGTLLNSQKEIDEQTKQRLIEAQKKGIAIVIATGRSKGTIEFVSEPLQLDKGTNFVAGVNGQVVYDFAKKEYFVDTVLDGNDANRMMNLGKKMGFQVIACCGYDHYQFTPHLWRIKENILNFIKGKQADYGFKRGNYYFVEVTNPNYPITKDVNKVVLRQSDKYFEKHIEKIKQELSDYEVLCVGKNWIEIMPKGVSKGQALLRIGELLNIKPEQMMAFGDAENDIDMLKAVRYGIAMGNGMDCVKEVAFAVTDTNDRQGIAKALEKYVLTD